MKTLSFFTAAGAIGSILDSNYDKQTLIVQILCICIRALDKGSLVSSMCKRDLVKCNYGYTQCVIDCGPQNLLQIWASLQIQAGVPLCCVVLQAVF